MAERIMFKDPETGKMLFNHSFYGRTNIIPPPGTRVRKMVEPIINRSKLPRHTLTLNPKNNTQKLRNMSKRHTRRITQMGNNGPYMAAKAAKNNNAFGNQRLANQNHEKDVTNERHAMNRMISINQGREQRRTPHEQNELVAAIHRRVSASKAANQQGGRKASKTHKRRHSAFRVKNNK